MRRPPSVGRRWSVWFSWCGEGADAVTVVVLAHGDVLGVGAAAGGGVCRAGDGAVETVAVGVVDRHRFDAHGMLAHRREDLLSFLPGFACHVPSPRVEVAA